MVTDYDDDEVHVTRLPRYSAHPLHRILVLLGSYMAFESVTHVLSLQVAGECDSSLNTLLAWPLPPWTARRTQDSTLVGLLLNPFLP